MKTVATKNMNDCMACTSCCQTGICCTYNQICTWKSEKPIRQ